MRIDFSCGHVVTVNPSIAEKPICACGETRIQRVTAPPPSIRGVCAGPLVTPQKLGPLVVNLCANGAQPLPVPIDPRVEVPRKLSRHGR